MAGTYTLTTTPQTVATATTMQTFVNTGTQSAIVTWGPGRGERIYPGNGVDPRSILRVAPSGPVTAYVESGTTTLVVTDVISDAGLLGTAGVALDDLDSSVLGYLSITYATKRAPTIVLFGDSRTADCNFATSPNFYTTNLSWWDWGQARTSGGPVFEVVANSGVGGNTTAQMLARFATDVAAYSPQAMTLWGGTNDGWATTTDVDASVANMASILDLANKAGIYVFLCTETPKSSNNTFDALLPYYNDRLRYLAATLPGVEVWDFCGQITDPTSTTGSPKSTLLRDGVHLNALGTSTIATYVAGKLARFGSRVSTLPTSPVDSMGVTANSRNVVSNPLMTTATGGTLGTGDTGTIASGWTSSGTPTAVYSVVARADGYGNNIRAVITASDTSSKSLTNTPTTSRVVAGGTYVLEAGLDIASPSSLYVVQLLAQITVSGTSYFFGWGPQVQSPTAGDGHTALTGGIIRSRIFTVPQGTVSGVTVTLKVVHSQAGTSTVELGRVALRRVA